MTTASKATKPRKPVTPEAVARRFNAAASLRDASARWTRGEVRTLLRDAQQEGSLRIDVRPADLINGGRRIPLLREIFDEIDRQWRPDTRIGTLSIFFSDGLKILFQERGTYLENERALAVVPNGHLPSHAIAPVFGYHDTPAALVADLLVHMPPEILPTDPRWKQVGALLAEMVFGTSRAGKKANLSFLAALESAGDHLKKRSRKSKRKRPSRSKKS